MSPTWFEFGPTAALSGRHPEGRLLAQPGRAEHRPASPLTGGVRPFSGTICSRGRLIQWDPPESELDQAPTNNCATLSAIDEMAFGALAQPIAERRSGGTIRSAPSMRSRL